MQVKSNDFLFCAKSKRWSVVGGCRSPLPLSRIYVERFHVVVTFAFLFFVVLARVYFYCISCALPSPIVHVCPQRDPPRHLAYVPRSTYRVRRKTFMYTHPLGTHTHNNTRTEFDGTVIRSGIRRNCLFSTLLLPLRFEESSISPSRPRRRELASS